MQAKEPPHNTEMLEFCTTATMAVDRSSGNQATPSADVVNYGCSKMASNTALPLAKVDPVLFAVGRIALRELLPVELLQELDVLFIIGVLEHLLEWQPWVAAILLAWDVDVGGPVLPVVVTAIEDFGALWNSALLILIANMDALVTLEVLWPLEPAVAGRKVAVLQIDSRTADWFPLAGKWVELITLDINYAIVGTSEDEAVELRLRALPLGNAVGSLALLLDSLPAFG
jgi:hypothetical protein